MSTLDALKTALDRWSTNPGTRGPRGWWQTPEEMRFTGGDAAIKQIRDYNASLGNPLTDEELIAGIDSFGKSQYEWAGGHGYAADSDPFNIGRWSMANALSAKGMQPQADALINSTAAEQAKTALAAMAVTQQIVDAQYNAMRPAEDSWFETLMNTGITAGIAGGLGSGLAGLAGAGAGEVAGLGGAAGAGEAASLGGLGSLGSGLTGVDLAGLGLSGTTPAMAGVLGSGLSGTTLASLGLDASALGAAAGTAGGLSSLASTGATDGLGSIASQWAALEGTPTLVMGGDVAAGGLGAFTSAGGFGTAPAVSDFPLTQDGELAFDDAMQQGTGLNSPDTPWNTLNRTLNQTLAENPMLDQGLNAAKTIKSAANVYNTVDRIYDMLTTEPQVQQAPLQQIQEQRRGYMTQPFGNRNFDAYR